MDNQIKYLSSERCYLFCFYFC